MAGAWALAAAGRGLAEAPALVEAGREPAEAMEEAAKVTAAEEASEQEATEAAVAREVSEVSGAGRGLAAQEEGAWGSAAAKERAAQEEAGKAKGEEGEERTILQAAGWADAGSAALEGAAKEVSG